MGNYKEKLKNIKAFVFDVDGVFTDGSLYLMPGGSLVRKMNYRDGFAVEMAIKKGFKIAIISGGKDSMVVERFRNLGVYNIYMQSDSKDKDLQDFLEIENLDRSEVAYMGDELSDLHALEIAGLSCCPKDACENVLAVAEYISPKKGGEGCVRDLIEQTLREQKKWLD